MGMRLQRPKRWSTVKAVVTAFVFGAIGFFCIVLYGYSTEWWATRECERIREDLRSSNPSFDKNDAVIAKALCEAMNSPSWENVASSPHPVREPPLLIDAGRERQDDDEWVTFKRTSFLLASTVANSAEDLLKGPSLFRNRRLNPKDSYIPPATRAILIQWLATKQPGVETLRKAMCEVSGQELNYMIDRGVARFVTYSEIDKAKSPAEKAETLRKLEEHRRNLQAVGATPSEIDFVLKDTKIIFNINAVYGDSIAHATRRGDDRIFIGDLRRMPQTSAAAQAYYAIVMEFYSGVLQFFRDHASLQEREATKMLEGVDVAMARYRL